MSGIAPDKGAGVVPIVYMTFPSFVGGVHSMVTLACSILYTMLLTITSRGGSIENDIWLATQIRVFKTWEPKLKTIDETGTLHVFKIILAIDE